MENNYKTLKRPELKALARESGLRGYSQLRKADLIAFLQNNERWVQMSTWELQREPQDEVQTEARQPELEAPLTKRQLKHRRNKDSKLAKNIKNLEKENDNLKSQMEALEDKITKASESTNANNNNNNRQYLYSLTYFS